MTPRKDKRPINLNDDETHELSHNIESKLDDLIERIKKEFQIMLGILGDILLKVFQPLVENI